MALGYFIDEDVLLDHDVRGPTSIAGCRLGVAIVGSRSRHF